MLEMLVIKRPHYAPGKRRTRLQTDALRGLAPLLAMLVLAIAEARPAHAEIPLLGGDPAVRATSSREAQQNAAESLPLERLSPEDRQRVSDVLADVTIFRRMPVQVIDCDPDLYCFLAQHPDVVVNIWEVLGITQLEVRQLEPNLFSIIDRAGTKGTFRYLYSSPEIQLVYAEGNYQAPLMAKPIQGKTLLLLKSGFVQEADGRYTITNRLDTFVQVEQGGVEVLTKTLQPILTKIADGNFVQTVAFVSSLSKTAELNSPGVQRLARKLEGVDPQYRETLARLAAMIAARTNAESAIATLPSDSPSR